MKPKKLYTHPARKKRMARPEQRMHIAIFNFLLPRMALPMYRDQFLAFHVPNGGGRSKAEGEILKRMGVMAGVADIVMLFPEIFAGTPQINRPPTTVFIELKAYNPPPPVRLKKDGTPVKARARSEKTETGLEDSQIEFRNRVAGLGFRYVLLIAKDERDAINQIAALMREYGVIV